MKGPLVHGCYDQPTFKTLLSLGVNRFAFDLRVRSSQLVTLNSLREILGFHPLSETVLIFADDSSLTILAFIDLLKNMTKNILLEFRDNQKADFYESLQKPYLWYFRPDGDWRNILKGMHCRGVILPLVYQDLYRDLPELWHLVEQNQLQVYLHAENFSEAEFFEGKDNILTSLDLTTELQTSYRIVDQVFLKSMKIWRRSYESAAGQR